MGANLVEIDLRVTKFKAWNPEGKECSLKEPENTQEKVVISWGFTPNWFWAVEDIKSDFEWENRIKKWGSSQTEKENDDNGPNINPHPRKISFCWKNIIGPDQN